VAKKHPWRFQQRTIETQPSKQDNLQIYLKFVWRLLRRPYKAGQWWWIGFRDKFQNRWRWQIWWTKVEDLFHIRWWFRWGTLGRDKDCVSSKRERSCKWRGRGFVDLDRWLQKMWWWWHGKEDGIWIGRGKQVTKGTLKSN